MFEKIRRELEKSRENGGVVTLGGRAIHGGDSGKEVWIGSCRLWYSSKKVSARLMWSL